MQHCLKQIHFSKRLATFAFTVTATMIFIMATPSAQAQQTQNCLFDTDGNGVPSAGDTTQGAGSTGSNVLNIACGSGATATGAGPGSNIAFGYLANANGISSWNVVFGGDASNASGDNSRNVSVGWR